jgi:hypothetical protein
MVLTASGFVLSILGPGAWSLDHVLKLSTLWGWHGLAIAAVAGVGGAAGLLVGFWRPEKPALKLDDAAG